MSTSKAFTLIETLVAISIIALAISGPLYSAGRSITYAQNSRHQLIASFLAQEGVEYVHMLRDNAFLAAYRTESASATTNGWNAFMSGDIANCVTPHVCSLDPIQGVSPHLSQCVSGSCTPLYVLTNGVYTQTTTIPDSLEQPYTRQIEVTAVGGGVQVTSTVTWSYHNQSFSTTITDYLLPWQ